MIVLMASMEVLVTPVKVLVTVKNMQDLPLGAREIISKVS